jgi:hypothetical protein
VSRLRVQSYGKRQQTRDRICWPTFSGGLCWAKSYESPTMVPRDRQLVTSAARHPPPTFDDVQRVQLGDESASLAHSNHPESFPAQLNSNYLGHLCLTQRLRVEGERNIATLDARSRLFGV